MLKTYLDNLGTAMQAFPGGSGVVTENLRTKVQGVREAFSPLAKETKATAQLKLIEELKTSVEQAAPQMDNTAQFVKLQNEVMNMITWTNATQDTLVRHTQDLLILEAEAGTTMEGSPFHTSFIRLNNTIQKQVDILHPNSAAKQVVDPNMIVTARDWLESQLKKVHEAELTLHAAVAELQQLVRQAEATMGGSKFFQKVIETCNKMMKESETSHPKQEHLPAIHSKSKLRNTPGLGVVGAQGQQLSLHGLPIVSTPAQIKHDQMWEAIAAGLAVVSAYLAATAIPMASRSLEPVGWGAAGCIIFVTFGSMLVPTRLIKEALLNRDEATSGVMGALLRQVVAPNSRPSAMTPEQLRRKSMNAQLAGKSGSEAGLGLNTLGGPLNQRMTMPSRDDRARLFRRMDVEGNGVLTHADVKRAVNELWGTKIRNAQVLMRAFDAADHSLDGTIGRTQFRMLLQYVIFFNQNWDLFSAIDLDHDQRIVWEEFTRGLDTLGLNLTEIEQRQIFQGMDEDQGFVRYAEFCSWAARRCVSEGKLDAAPGQDGYAGAGGGMAGNLGGFGMGQMNQSGQFGGQDMSMRSQGAGAYGQSPGMSGIQRSGSNQGQSLSLLDSPKLGQTGMTSYIAAHGALLLPSEEQRARIFRTLDAQGMGLVAFDVVKLQVMKLWGLDPSTPALNWALQAADVNSDGMVSTQTQCHTATRDTYRGMFLTRDCLWLCSDRAH